MAVPPPSAQLTQRQSPVAAERRVALVTLKGEHAVTLSPVAGFLLTKTHATSR